MIHSNKKIKTFKHSGDMGDIIYSLPTVKNLGGGILYLDLEGGKDDEFCREQLKHTGGRTKFNINSFNFLKELILKQEYIQDVKIFSGESIDYNLNKMRNRVITPDRRSKHGCLIDLHREAFGLSEYDENIPWLDCGEPIKLSKPLLVSRSPRYQSAHVTLDSNKKALSEQGIFIGLKREHELFEWTFNIEIDFFESNCALEIAKVIKGSETLISNSTFNLSLAMGVGHKNIIQEMDKLCLMTLFPKKEGMQRI